MIACVPQNNQPGFPQLLGVVRVGGCRDLIGIWGNKWVNGGLTQVLSVPMQWCKCCLQV